MASILGIGAFLYSWLATPEPFIPLPEVFRIDTINSFITNDTSKQKIEDQPFDNGSVIHPKSDSLQAYIPQDDTSTNILVIKTLKYQSVSAGGNGYKDDEVTQLTEAPPPTGFGKLAVRVSCPYCNRGGEINVYDSYGEDLYSYGIATQYDSLNKLGTTFLRDLKPGNYTVALSFGDQGSDTINCLINEGKAFLIHLDKSNPFGDGNCKLIFRSFDYRIKKVEIFVDNVSRGVAKITNKKMYFIILEKGRHTFYYKNLEPDEFSNISSKLDFVDVNVGVTDTLDVK